MTAKSEWCSSELNSHGGFREDGREPLVLQQLKKKRARERDFPPAPPDGSADAPALSVALATWV